MSDQIKQDKELVSQALNSLLESGANKAVCRLHKSQKHELTSESGKISLMRTTFDTDLSYKVIKDSKLGTTSSNKTDNDSVKTSVKNVIELADSAKEDEAYDIAQKSEEPQTFSSGVQKADYNKMHERISEFLEDVKTKYPKTIFERCSLEYDSHNSIFQNSNGVEHTITNGCYALNIMFTSKDGKKTSSFNYCMYALKDLNKKLLEIGNIENLIKQSAEQIEVSPIKGKFDGDIIITPECLMSMLYTLKAYFSDMKLISGTSPLKNKLGEKVFDSKLTLLSDSLDDRFAYKEFITKDGLKTSPTPLIENGVLKTFILSIYGANKTGNTPSTTGDTGLIVAPGDTPYSELVKNVKKGVLLCRFSGGSPNDNGDFSGSAKNSYYIEDGEIKYPISETMITANILDMFKNINGVSSETVNFGFQDLPWISVNGVTISGK